MQKRKDPSHKWFLNDVIDCNPIVKQIMSGKKFMMIKRYLYYELNLLVIEIIFLFP